MCLGVKKRMQPIALALDVWQYGKKSVILQVRI